MRYLREFRAREIILKAYTYTGSHLSIKELFERLWKWDINGIKWQIMRGSCSIDESFE